MIRVSMLTNRYQDIGDMGAGGFLIIKEVLSLVPLRKI
jgi:hypothetical protein